MRQQYYNISVPYAFNKEVKIQPTIVLSLLNIKVPHFYGRVETDVFIEKYYLIFERDLLVATLYLAVYLELD